MNSKPAYNLLLIEDDPDDVEFIREAFSGFSSDVTVRSAWDGEEALSYLYQEEPHQDAPRPDLILLDLNLPRKHGQDVLEKIKQEESLKKIPVIILTTSPRQLHVEEGYRLGANCYIEKPVGVEQLEHVMKMIHDFWLSVAEIPDANCHD